jgi:hypothetical protein
VNVPHSWPAALLLALTLACRTAPADREHLIYAPHEEGLTLAYENPRLEGNARTDSRLQVRVDKALPAAGGAIVGELRHTWLSGEETFGFELKEGGLKVADEHRRMMVALPEGFPDRVSVWEDGGIRSRILGRGTSPLFDRFLPKDALKVGIWIESTPLKGEGARTRTFLLPDVGSAEVMEWKDGRWSTSMRLVGRGFTDAKPKALPVSLPAVLQGGKKKT